MHRLTFLNLTFFFVRLVEVGLECRRLLLLLESLNHTIVMRTIDFFSLGLPLLRAGCCRPRRGGLVHHRRRRYMRVGLRLAWLGIVRHRRRRVILRSFVLIHGRCGLRGCLLLRGRASGLNLLFLLG